MSNITFENFTDVGSSTVNICSEQETTSRGFTLRARSVFDFLRGLTWRHVVALCFFLALFVIVIAVSVYFSKRETTQTVNISEGNICLIPSYRAKHQFVEDPDFVAFILFFWPWTSEMDDAASQMYNETISRADYWAEKIFQSSSRSSCITSSAINVIKLGSNTLLLLHGGESCKNMTAEDIKEAYDEGYSFLQESQDKDCVVNISKSIYVEARWRDLNPSEPVSPLPINDTICGQSQLYPVPRIVGGRPVYRGQYPWLVMLRISEIRGEFLCGGTIWDYDHILTAAHCIANLPRDEVTGLVNTSSVEVWAGKWENKAETFPFEQYVRATSGRIHKGYKSDLLTLINDIAVLKVAQSLQPTQLVMKVCHPDANTRIPNTAVVAGWGKTSSDFEITPPVLLSVKLSLLTHSACATVFSFGSNGLISLPNGTLCAIGDEFEGKDSCQGDSGGPLFSNLGTGGAQRHTIIGVVSYGFECGVGGSPGVYASVQFYLDWIEESITFLQ